MYALGMSNVGVAEARKNLASVIERAQREPVVIARRGRAQAVVVSPEHFDAMREALEEIEDARACGDAMGFVCGWATIEFSTRSTTTYCWSSW